MAVLDLKDNSTGDFFPASGNPSNSAILVDTSGTNASAPNAETQVNASTTAGVAVTALAINAKLVEYTFQNTSSYDMWINTKATAAVNAGLLVKAGTSITRSQPAGGFGAISIFCISVGTYALSYWLKP